MDGIFQIHGNCTDQQTDFNNLKENLENMDQDEKLRLLRIKVNRQTPFAIACEAGSLRTVQLLLDHGATIEYDVLQKEGICEDIRDHCNYYHLGNRARNR